jgi:chromosome segregation ATPase
MRRTAGLIAVSGVLLAGWTALRAQPAPPAAPAQSDIMPALLEEVRGLRAALEQMSSAGPRVQLALGRLQLQEQRLGGTIKRLEEVRARLADVQRQQADMQQQVASLDLALKEGPRGLSGADGPPREEIEHVLVARRRELAQINTEVQRLNVEESALATDVTNEQARWTEFNQRLEDLERALRPLKF